MPILNPKAGMSISDLTPNFTGREWGFQAVHQWLSAPNPSRYFLLTGEPGAGNTSISNQLSQCAQPPFTQPYSPVFSAPFTVAQPATALRLIPKPLRE